MLRARRAERFEVGPLDRAPVPQVVAQQQRGPHVLWQRRRQLDIARRAVTGPAVDGGDGPPETLGDEGDQRDQRSLARDGKVVARADGEVRRARVVVVVDDVDAADKRHPVIDHRDLSMQPAQQPSIEAPPDARTEHAQLHAAGGQALLQCRQPPRNGSDDESDADDATRDAFLADIQFSSYCAVPR